MEGREKTGNHRPVNRTSVVGAVLDSIFKDLIAEHLKSSGRIRQSQQGFMKGKSCLTNLLEFFQDVTLRVGKGEPVDVVCLDFQKAFDEIPHKRLSCKIKGHEFGGSALKWIENG